MWIFGKPYSKIWVTLKSFGTDQDTCRRLHYRQWGLACNNMRYSQADVIRPTTPVGRFEGVMDDIKDRELGFTDRKIS
jgi:hypothetical protein